jgi:hypothetical protein
MTNTRQPGATAVTWVLIPPLPIRASGSNSAMASQTKVEPVQRPKVKAPASSVAVSRSADTEATVADRSAPESSIEASTTTAGDDEDVSLDELMMSDSSDGDAPASRPLDKENSPSAAPSVQSAEVGAKEEETPGAPLDPYAVDPEDDEAAALAAAAAAQEAAAEEAAAEADARAAASRRSAEAPASRPSSRSSQDVEPSAGAQPADDADEPRTGQIAAVQVPAPLPPVTELAGEEPDDGPPLGMDFGNSELEAPAEPAGSAARVAPVLSAPASGPAQVQAKTQDGPLPSFEIPEPDASSRRRRPVAPGDEHGVSQLNPRPLATPLSHLSESGEEDDDDAVTHIGLPVVPESVGEYADLGATGFQVADAGALSIQGFEPDLSLLDARRATTRVLPRVDPSLVPPRRETRDTRDTNPSMAAVRRRANMGAWLSGVFQRYRPEPPAADLSAPPRRRTAWLLDAVLPPLSLVLFGSGIGAGIMLLLQPDRGTRVAAAQSVQALREVPAAKRPVTLQERAEAGEGDALFKITSMPPDERNSALTLALERGHQAQKQSEFQEFQKSLQAPAGLSQPNLSNRFLGYVTSPETMLVAFGDLLAWPGSTGPEVLYAVWEKAPGGSRAASLAQQLLHSEDQRGKATPALRTALDLRSATSCEDYLSVLPAVQRDGDQRCSATLRALKHRDGCGDDGQKDCFACLRDGTLLDDALTAIEKRVPPQL